MFNINSRIKLKKDTFTNWSNHPNYVLLNGEVGIVVFADNTIGIKIGDGTTAFSNLDYVKLAVLNSESLSVGDIISNSGVGSSAFGDHLNVSGQYSIVAGTSAESDENWTFTWNGDSTRINNKYESHGSGTFNVNPKDNVNGFYIGDDKISDIFQNKFTIEERTALDYSVQKTKTKITFLDNSVEYYTWYGNITKQTLVRDEILGYNIYTDTYYWLNDIKEIEISQFVTGLENNIFSGCNNLTKITVIGKNQQEANSLLANTGFNGTIKTLNKTSKEYVDESLTTQLTQITNRVTALEQQLEGLENSLHVVNTGENISNNGGNE